MKKSRIISLVLAVGLAAVVNVRGDIDGEGKTNDLDHVDAILKPQVTPSSNAYAISDPAPPSRPAIPKTAKTSNAKESSPSDLGKYMAIVERSPFRNVIVPVAGSAPGVASNQQLHLNGIIRIGDQLSAGLEDTIQKKSVILAVGQKEEGIEIQSINEQDQTVYLLYNGQEMTLAMDKSPNVAGAPAMSMPPSPTGTPPNSGIQPAGNPQQPVMKRRRIIIPREN